MILLDQALERAIAQSGITLVPFTVFRYDKPRLTSLFMHVLEEYSAWRPKKVKNVWDIATSLMLPDEVIGVSSVSPGSSSPSPYTLALQQSKLGSRSWLVDVRELLVPSSGVYYVTTLNRYIAKIQEVSYLGPSINALMPTFNFRLIGDYQPGTLTLTLGADSAIDDGARALSGSLGTGTVNPNNMEVSFTMTTPSTGTIFVSFTSLCVGVKELFMDEVPFLDLFTADLLMGFGNAKEMLVLEGIPVDLELQYILEQGKLLREKTDTLIRSDSNWWQFDA